MTKKIKDLSIPRNRCEKKKNNSCSKNKVDSVKRSATQHPQNNQG